MHKGDVLVKESPIYKVYKELPLSVKTQVDKFSAVDQEAFVEEYKRKRLKTVVAALLWLFFGCHYLYLKKWGTQILYWLTVGGCLIWALIDAFRLQGMIADRNKDAAIEALKNFKAMKA